MFARIIAVAILVAAAAAPSKSFELPKEVTPDLRRACEKDVRRLCIHKDSTVASVKSCVIANFSKLNTNCKIRLVRAGL